MSKSDGFFIRPKFPVAEQDESVKPQPQEAPAPKQMTIEQVNADFVQELTGIGVQVPEKCKTCKSLIPCVTLQLLTGPRK